MKDQSKLFEEELARRNPDWEKIVAVHNEALAAAEELQIKTAVRAEQSQIKLATAVEALKEIREVALKTDWELAKGIDATLEKITK